MSEGTALLEAIRAAPEDDGPRLVYADWLEENGQPERAEFIRVQCAVARQESRALRRREGELLAAHHDAFAGPLAAPGLRFRFHRGFIVGFGHTGLFMMDERGAQSGSYYRFHWDFSWQGIVGPQTVDEAIEVIGQMPGDYYHHSPSRYRFEVACVPASIWFGLEATPSGLLLPDPVAGLSPTLEIINRSSGRESRKRFFHAHRDRFDSFPES